MKKIFFMLIAAISLYSASAQNSELAVRVIVPENSGIPVDARSSFETRLRNIVNTYGIVSDDRTISQFTITARADIRSQNIVGSAPTIYAVDVDINLYVGDWLMNTQIENTSFRAKGTGQSEAKAYLSALDRLNLNSPAIKSFLDKGKQRIIDFYETQGDIIFGQVDHLVKMNDYEKAIYMLLSVPSLCKSTYDKAQEKLYVVFQEYIDYQGNQLLNKANAIWIAQQNRQGAELAANLLTQINPASSAMPEAQKLNSEIKKRVGQEWELELKVISDLAKLEQQKIEAAKQVGIAYGNGQKPNTTNFVH